MFTDNSGPKGYIDATSSIVINVLLFRGYVEFHLYLLLSVALNIKLLQK
jgi:hypothetical protein